MRTEKSIVDRHKFSFSQALKKFAPVERKIGLHAQINSDTIMLLGYTRPYTRLFIQRKKYESRKKKISAIAQLTLLTLLVEISTSKIKCRESNIYISTKKKNMTEFFLWVNNDQ